MTIDRKALAALLDHARQDPHRRISNGDLVAVGVPSSQTGLWLTAANRVASSEEAAALAVDIADDVDEAEAEIDAMTPADLAKFCPPQ